GRIDNRSTGLPMLSEDHVGCRLCEDTIPIASVASVVDTLETGSPDQRLVDARLDGRHLIVQTDLTWKQVDVIVNECLDRLKPADLHDQRLHAVTNARARS